jgi:hypothetical protein
LTDDPWFGDTTIGSLCRWPVSLDIAKLNSFGPVIDKHPSESYADVVRANARPVEIACLSGGAELWLYHEAITITCFA